LIDGVLRWFSDAMSHPRVAAIWWFVDRIGAAGNTLRCRPQVGTLSVNGILPVMASSPEDSVIVL
jgi:hypothetical protein